jgi:hypothetical protein
MKNLHFPVVSGRIKSKVFLHMPVSISIPSSEEAPPGDSFFWRPIADCKGVLRRGQTRGRGAGLPGYKLRYKLVGYFAF